MMGKWPETYWLRAIATACQLRNLVVTENVGLTLFESSTGRAENRILST